MDESRHPVQVFKCVFYIMSARTRSDLMWATVTIQAMLVQSDYFCHVKVGKKVHQNDMRGASLHNYILYFCHCVGQ